ncbi:hypothetical protein [Paracoccus sp. S3-43]|uniref:hypothetical protein n=1 Tax=Paracoccus sp. S3-43 TaxID=3030011 RepID=UPI0023B05B5C|nr:hypothetical protein [Paracoccus sp. S3-43]WEF25174.1 hypothetical protein PXD02_04320 [Paracoccus sp. S3-43]
MHVEGRLDLAEIGGAGHRTAFWDRRDEGFVSPDWNVTVGQRSAGLDGRVEIGGATALTFGATRFHDDAGKRDDRERIGIDHWLSRAWQVEAEIARRDLANPTALARARTARPPTRPCA